MCVFCVSNGLMRIDINTRGVVRRRVDTWDIPCTAYAIDAYSYHRLNSIKLIPSSALDRPGQLQPFFDSTKGTDCIDVDVHCQRIVSSARLMHCHYKCEPPHLYTTVSV